MPKMPCPESVAPLARLAPWLSGCPLLWALDTWLRWQAALLPADDLDLALAPYLVLTQIEHSRATTAPDQASDASQSR
jgi:hypothetical protein